jgi:hypothetical protein
MEHLVALAADETASEEARQAARVILETRPTAPSVVGLRLGRDQPGDTRLADDVAAVLVSYARARLTQPS